MGSECKTYSDPGLALYEPAEADKAHAQHQQGHDRQADKPSFFDANPEGTQNSPISLTRRRLL
jgi:hypothetical protein